MFKVEQITPESNSLEDLQEYIAKLSSVVRDKHPKNNEKLFSRLLVESIGDTASRVLEYIPCVIGKESVGINSQHQHFGFWDTRKVLYYTNARELLNWGMSLKEVLTYLDFTHYKVFKCEAPYFIYGQVSTHNQLTTVSHSQRFADCERGYWIPPEVEEYYTGIEPNVQEFYNKHIEDKGRLSIAKWFKACGVKRKEVFDRGTDMLQNRVFTIGGYTNNPNAWEHFFKQRLDKHTQLETREFASMLFSYKEG